MRELKFLQLPEKKSFDANNTRTEGMRNETGHPLRINHNDKEILSDYSPSGLRRESLVGPSFQEKWSLHPRHKLPFAQRSLTTGKEKLLRVTSSELLKNTAK